MQRSTQQCQRLDNVTVAVSQTACIWLWVCGGSRQALGRRFHNLQETQLRKAREVLDFFGSVARQISMETVGSELETLAFAALQRARPVRSSCYRAIIALDIEGSTSRPDPVKAELRTKLYELFDAALRSAGIYPRHRDRFIDRGDGLLALIRPVDRAPKALLLNRRSAAGAGYPALGFVKVRPQIRASV